MPDDPVRMVQVAQHELDRLRRMEAERNHLRAEVVRLREQRRRMQAWNENLSNDLGSALDVAERWWVRALVGAPKMQPRVTEPSERWLRLYGETA